MHHNKLTKYLNFYPLSKGRKNTFIPLIWSCIDYLFIFFGSV